MIDYEGVHPLNLTRIFSIPIANDGYVNLYAGKNIVCPLRMINSSLEMVIPRKVQAISLLLRLASTRENTRHEVNQD
jgi:hypothetical protein